MCEDYDSKENREAQIAESYEYYLEQIPVKDEDYFKWQLIAIVKDRILHDSGYVDPIGETKKIDEPFKAMKWLIMDHDPHGKLDDLWQEYRGDHS